MAPAAITTYEDNTFLTSTAQVKNFSPIIANHGVKHTNAQQLIGQALKQRVDAIDPEDCEAGEEDAFFVADLGEVYRQHLRWKLHLARVKPHYGELDYSRCYEIA
jgi:ornithine decarboxylase